MGRIVADRFLLCLSFESSELLNTGSIMMEMLPLPPRYTEHSISGGMCGIDSLGGVCGIDSLGGVCVVCMEKEAPGH